MQHESPTKSPADTPPSPPTAVCGPELLSPAGDWECARAAVENGADAIYFGLDQFNARMRARNFTVADLPELMAFLHRRGVRGYVTFNTLVFPGEMAAAAALVRTLIQTGVDAAIVQDVGICRLIRQLSPDFPIHASTQMTVTSAAGVAFARELGCNLVVLAREVPIQEISRIQAAAVPPESGLPIEVFVHGALCVAYSGQCLTSESLGGRSANRGVCAQACRLPYELLAEGAPVDLGDRRYLLSPQDLAGLETLPELLRAGVTSLKIEGRLKSPEYVANITRVYRQAIDQVVAGLRAAPLDCGASEDPGFGAQATAHRLAAASRYDLEMAFSRGLYTGWLHGVNHQALVHGRFGKKRGVFLGAVESVRADEVVLQLAGPLKAGDGVVFDAGRPDLEEEGGRVYQVIRRGGSDATPRVGLRFGRGDLRLDRVRPGHKVWKTSDPELERRLRRSYAGDTPRHLRPLDVRVSGAEGLPLRVVAQDEAGQSVQAESQQPLVRAESQPLTTDRLREQLGRLGGTSFRLGQLQSDLPANLILPVSELNRLRRDLVRQLDAVRGRPRPWSLRAIEPRLTVPTPTPDAAPPVPPELVVLVRSLPQLEAALGCGLRTLYCELEDPKRYRDAVRLVQSCPAADRPTLWVAPPRIFKMGEDWTLRQVQSAEADGYLVRNYDHLRWFDGRRRIGDFSLNVANALTAEYFMERFGLERVTASYDLNHAELAALLRSAPPHWFEIVIHQHMPMFHMEHCVFCAFLSQGTDYTNCGRPCDRRELRLRDRAGAAHPIKADAGCRNTVFNALAQTGAEHLPEFVARGVRWLRLEFLDESPAELARTVEHYRRLLRGELTGGQLWRELKVFHHLGVTRGPMG